MEETSPRKVGRPLTGIERKVAFTFTLTSSNVDALKRILKCRHSDDPASRLSLSGLVDELIADAVDARTPIQRILQQAIAEKSGGK